MVNSSTRRFDLGSATQPIIQFIVATLPLFFLLLWFLFNARSQVNSSCYDAVAIDDDQALAIHVAECSKLIPLEQFLYVYLVAEFGWILLAMYLTFYVPRRHGIINEYLTKGETVIGTVYFNRKKFGLSLTSYGHVVYEHDSKMVRRKVQVFERYTRELAAILRLPGLPHSGQPKVDLEIDRDVIELNRSRVKVLVWYAWAWSVFCMLGPIYIVEILKVLQSRNPDSAGNFTSWFYILAFVLIPSLSLLWNWSAWTLHRRWMTLQHKILEDGESPNEPERGCCFDDDDCESIQMTDYVQMSAATNTTRKGAKIGFA
jgi:hypothetical protein